MDLDMRPIKLGMDHLGLAEIRLGVFNNDQTKMPTFPQMDGQMKRRHKEGRNI